MSTVATKGQSATASDAKSKSQVQPVALFDSPIAKAIAIARPGVLFGGCFASLGAMTNDPVATLQMALPAVTVVQIAYVVACVPVAGSQAAKSPSRKARPGEKKSSDYSGPSLVVATILSLILTAISMPAVHLLFVLFGAPFLSHILHTFLCAAHFSILAIFPIFWARAVNGQEILAIAGAYAPIDEIFGGLLGAVLGAWLGAVPIPLDWDREWQKWPITVVQGMYLGYLVGVQVVGNLFYGKTLAGESEKEDEEE